MPKGAHQSQGGPRTSKDRDAKSNKRPVPGKFLLLCEGDTEASYFQSFPMRPKMLTAVPTGMQGMRLVTEAQERLRLLRHPHRNEDVPDQLWVVFDRDDISPDEFNKAVLALEPAEQEYAPDPPETHLRIAYSNESFELWFVLHYQFHNTPSVRQWYCDKVEELIGEHYDKNRTPLYDTLHPLQATAIAHAKRLHAEQASATPADGNPCTTVYALVEELNANSN